MRLWLDIALFLLFQVAAALLFKWGSSVEGRWWAGFACGNLVGVSSILFLMRIYHALHPNLAAAVCTGGSFLLIQLTLAFCFSSGLSAGQWGGVCLMSAGIALIALA